IARIGVGSYTQRVSLGGSSTEPLRPGSSGPGRKADDGGRGMRRGRYLGILAAAGLATAVAVGVWRPWGAAKRPGAPSSRPNVVLISLDTTRADHLSCHGYSRPTTPSLDRLAARGVRYANARSQAPWPLPSHLALLTSLLPSP